MVFKGDMNLEAAVIVSTAEIFLYVVDINGCYANQVRIHFWRSKGSGPDGIRTHANNAIGLK